MDFTLEALSALICNLSLSCCCCDSLLEASHHHDELLELDLSVTVLINLLDDGVDGLQAERVGSTKAQNLSYLISRDGALAVLVEHLEGSLEFLLGSDGRLVSSGDNKLSVLDKARVVRIDGLEHLLYFLVGHYSSVVLKISYLDLFHGELSVTVGVKGLEDILKLVALCLTH